MEVEESNEVDTDKEPVLDILIIYPSLMMKLKLEMNLIKRMIKMKNRRKSMHLLLLEIMVKKEIHG